jgi:hypothetical protein
MSKNKDLAEEVKYKPEIEWSPLTDRVIPITGLVLQKSGKFNYRFKPSTLIKLFYPVLPVAYLLLFKIFYESKYYDDSNYIILFLFTLFLTGVYLFFFMNNSQKIFIDTKRKFIKLKPINPFSRIKKQTITFKEIDLIQVLTVYSVAHDRHSYELNLVLKDNYRVHLVNHNNRRFLFKDAHKLADLIGVDLRSRI